MRSRTTASLRFLTSAAAVLYALPVLAEAADGAKPGLPQLDTSLFPEQLFWLAVTFATLYLLMAYVALPGVNRTQDNRRTIINKEIATAALASEQARATMAHYEKALADARTEAHATVAAITAKAALEAAAQQTAQKQAINKRLREAEAKISVERDIAIIHIEKSATELGQNLVERVTGLKTGLTSMGGQS